MMEDIDKKYPIPNMHVNIRVRFQYTLSDYPELLGAYEEAQEYPISAAIDAYLEPEAGDAFDLFSQEITFTDPLTGALMSLDDVKQRLAARDTILEREGW